MDLNFIEKYGEIIRERQVLGPNQECKLWTGAIKKCGPTKQLKYGVVGCKINGKWVTVAAHRLSYSLQYGVHLDQLNREGYDISHLCHNSLCINPHHLSFEPHSVNNNRQRCKNKKECTFHENRPMCLLNLIITGILNSIYIYVHYIVKLNTDIHHHRIIDLKSEPVHTVLYKMSLSNLLGLKYILTDLP
jgi:hypothetical protein